MSSPPLLAGWISPDALGRPGEGVHAPRLAGLAAVDLAGTAAAAYVAARYLAGGSGARLYAYACAAFVLLWALGAALHWAAGVDSAGNRALAAALWPAPARRVTWADPPAKSDSDDAAPAPPAAPAPTFATLAVPRTYA